LENTVKQLGLSTRVLLVCAAFAAVHLLLHLATGTFLAVLAPTSPPLYALGAGVHGVLPFVARRYTGAVGSATITAGIAGLLIAATSPSGVIILVPFLLTGTVIDLVVWKVDHGDRGPRSVQARYLLAAVILGAALFGVSLAVFSPEHLTVPIVLGTLLGRIVGEVVAAVLSGMIARALQRAGVGTRSRRASSSRR
jgi:hypothetical protein